MRRLSIAIIAAVIGYPVAAAELTAAQVQALLPFEVIRNAPGFGNQRITLLSVRKESGHEFVFRVRIEPVTGPR